MVNIPNADSRVLLSKLTIQNGLAGGGGKVPGLGGSIHNLGTLTVSNCIVSKNTVNGKYLTRGGGFYNGGTLTISNSTITGNTASGTVTSAYGGGIYNAGVLTINNSTLGRNNARGPYNGYDPTSFGGGIYSSGTLVINNSTLNANDLIEGQGAGIYNAGSLAINNSTLSANSAGGFGSSGGGIYNRFSATTLQNSIIANNSPMNCVGGIISEGYNLSSDGTCNFSGPGDLNNTEPKLGLLQNNGGPTQTQALLPGSPAIDAGNPNGCTDGNGHLLKTDQRGAPRPDKEDTGGCDMGAFERQKD